MDNAAPAPAEDSSASGLTAEERDILAQIGVTDPYASEQQD